MSKKKKLAFIISLVLVAVIGIGATLAYMTSTTGAVVNTFTVGNVKLALWENEVNEDGQIIKGDNEKWVDNNDYHMVPNQIVDKNPFVVVEKGSEDSIVFINLTGMDELMQELTSKEGDDAASDLAVLDFNTTNWLRYDAETAGPGQYDGLYYYNGIITAEMAEDGDWISESLFGKLQLSEDAVGFEEEVSLTQIQLTAAAIQAKNLTDSTDFHDIVQAAYKALYM